MKGMLAGTFKRANPLVVFTGVALLINLAIAAMVRLPLDGARHRAIAIGASFDLLLTVPALYYLLVVRRRARPFATIWIVVALGSFRTLFLVPWAGPLKPVLAGAGEAALIAYVLVQARRGRAGEQGPVLRAIAWELDLFRCAFRLRRGPERIATGAQTFTIHRESGFTSVLGVVICLSFIETPLVHLVVQRWSVTGAWVATAVSLYGALWLTALCRSFELRPIVLSADRLELRKGLLWRVSIPLEKISGVDRLPLSGWKKSPGLLAIAAGAEPKLLIALSGPVVAQGPYGIRKQVTAVGIAADGGATLEQALLRAIGR